jgi:hypothetical protein
VGSSCAPRDLVLQQTLGTPKAVPRDGVRARHLRPRGSVQEDVAADQFALASVGVLSQLNVGVRRLSERQVEFVAGSSRPSATLGQ